MNLSICVIDDEIPASKEPSIYDYKRLNSSNLKLLLSNGAIWDKKELKDLIEELIKKTGEWDISAFTDPSLYLNCHAEELYSPEIIILDLDFPTTPKSTEEHIMDILMSSFSIVYIYTQIR